MPTNTEVSWKSYAQKYDMLLSYNPFYQAVHQEVLAHTKQWQIKAGDYIADVGAGTGNYSLAIAQQFPQAHVLHVDSDEGMNAVTADKRVTSGIKNHDILDRSIEDVVLKPESLKALVSIHALYTFPNPQEALRKMYQWLEPGGCAVLVDAGRIVKVRNWQMAIGWHLLRHHGLKKTLQIMREGKEVSRQNAYIRGMQRQGKFWLHSHGEFCETVRKAGFKIEQSGITFRGISDIVVARKI